MEIESAFSFERRVEHLTGYRLREIPNGDFIGDIVAVRNGTYVMGRRRHDDDP